MNLQSKAILLKLIIALTVFSQSCERWDENQSTALAELSDKLIDQPNDPALLSRLRAGMYSSHTLKACFYIETASSLAEHQAIRSELENVVEARVFGSDPWVASACARELTTLVDYNWSEAENIIKASLQTGANSVAGYALEAIKSMGSDGAKYVPSIIDYMKLVEDSENLSFLSGALRALLSIGTRDALEAAIAYSNFHDPAVRHVALRCQALLDEGRCR